MLLYSLAAYAGAILLKYLVQIPTVGALNAAYGNHPLVLGIYYGTQTAIFEVGGAFIVASMAVSRRRLGGKDAESFGLGLAFWENGVLIGLPLLIDYVSYYAILSAPSSSAAQTLYPILAKDAAALFYAPSGALPLVGYSILERVSSLMAHFSWGYLCVLAAVYRKRVFLAAAFPVAFLIDFLVPFSNSLGIGLFELTVFGLGAGSLAVAWTITRGVLKVSRVPGEGDSEPVGDRRLAATVGTLSALNFRRSVNYGKVYLALGIAITIVTVVAASFLPTTPQTHQYIQSQGQALGINNGQALVIVSIYPIISPLFAVIGALGALMIFGSDKAKGVYEYLIAYGVNTSSIFWSIVVSAIGLATIVLVVSLPVVTLMLVGLNGSVPFEFVELVLVYTIPLSYAATMFTTMIGMIWSSLATRRAGVNSPVGVAPIFGIIPILLVLLLSERVPAGYLVPLVGGVTVVLVTMVAAIIVVSTRKMARERFISNA